MYSSIGLMVYVCGLRRVVVCTAIASCCGDINDGAPSAAPDGSMATCVLVSHSDADDLDSLHASLFSGMAPRRLLPSSVSHFVDDRDDVLAPTVWFDYEDPRCDDPVRAVYSDDLVDFAPYDPDGRVSGIRQFPGQLRPISSMTTFLTPDLEFNAGLSVSVFDVPISSTSPGFVTCDDFTVAPDSHVNALGRFVSIWVASSFNIYACFNDYGLCYAPLRAESASAASSSAPPDDMALRTGASSVLSVASPPVSTMSSTVRVIYDHST